MSPNATAVNGGGVGEGPAAPATASAPNHTSGQSMTMRARRRREEAVRRLVAEVQAQQDPHQRTTSGAKFKEDKGPATALHPETHDWLVASVTATALEKGLDRDLHTALVQEAKDNAGRIGQICQDHADVFLDSVQQVAALLEPSQRLSHNLEKAQQAMTQGTGPMVHAASLHAHALLAHERAQTAAALLSACRTAALALERGRKQAAAGRPRSALRAVDQARHLLARPLQSLVLQSNVMGTQGQHSRATAAALALYLGEAAKKTTLQETPFGKRAMLVLPKIENEVLMGARRNLNRWFLNLRSGGDGSKAGRSVLRKAARALAVGPGHLGLGGQGPTSYVWRAKTADNVLSRVALHGKVARALRQAYWFDRDGQREGDLIMQQFGEGLERKAEAIAAAFGWYRCWEVHSEPLVDPTEWGGIGGADQGGLSGSSHGGGGTGLSGSRHGPGGSAGLSGSNHGGLSGSRHGKKGGGPGGKRSLGFRASTSSKSQAFQEISSTLGNVVKSNASGVPTSVWNELWHPTVLYERTPGRGAEDEIYAQMPESVHPVRRAETAFSLLGRAEEFVQYYEQNRFGEIKVVATTNDMSSPDGGTGKQERKSYLSSLTGDDVTVGNDRIFFAKTLPHLAASIVGFAVVEAALELGNFDDDDDDDDDLDLDGVRRHGNADGGSHPSGGGGASDSAGGSGGGDKKNAKGDPRKGGKNAKGAAGISASRFRESSERYERSLVNELSTLLKGRTSKATLVELVKASHLMASLRASLRLVHPSSGARRHDRDLLTLSPDTLVQFCKIAREEQLKATGAIVQDDAKIPMSVNDFAYNAQRNSTALPKGPGVATGIPDPEVVGLPFGLSHMKQQPSAPIEEEDSADPKTIMHRNARSSRRTGEPEESYTFSQSVPVVLRSLHARSITAASFCLNQMELGQGFPVHDKNKGSPAAGFVMDCVEECINVAAMGLKDSDNTVDEGSVEKAVQVMANITAFQQCLPRFFAVLVRGMCHIGLVRGDEMEESLHYAEKTLKNADKACDAQIGSTYSLVYEICRNSIDSHINFALENFNWVAKSAREMPNAYCEGLVGYLKSVFNSLGPMDEGSRAGLHFSCCGHVSERLVRLLAGKPGDTTTMDNSSVQPITRIDAYGIRNLATDCDYLQKFADSTSVPQLRDCFSELKTLTQVMLDKDLPTLLLPENAGARRRRYPILSLEKVGNILEKYVGTGLGDKLMGSSGRSADMLFIDKKEVPILIKIVRNQQVL